MFKAIVDDVNLIFFVGLSTHRYSQSLKRLERASKRRPWIQALDTVTQRSWREVTSIGVPTMLLKWVSQQTEPFSVNPLALFYTLNNHCPHLCTFLYLPLSSSFSSTLSSSPLFHSCKWKPQLCVSVSHDASQTPYLPGGAGHLGGCLRWIDCLVPHVTYHRLIQPTDTGQRLGETVGTCF